MRSDVGERARRAAEVGLDAPVVVLRPQQPVLQVRAVHEPHSASLPTVHAHTRFSHDWVVAVDERDGRDAVGRGRQLGQPLRAGRVDGQRFLADDVLSGRQRGLGDGQVQVIRRADVHDVDVGCLGERFRALERPLGAQAPCGLQPNAQALTPRRRPAAPRRGFTARACTAPMNPVPAMPTRKLLSPMRRTVDKL